MAASGSSGQSYVLLRSHSGSSAPSSPVPATVRGLSRREARQKTSIKLGAVLDRLLAAEGVEFVGARDVEGFKEHAWKAMSATLTERHRNTSWLTRFNEFPPQNASRCEPVNLGVCRPLRGHLTQFLHSLHSHYASPRMLAAVQYRSPVRCVSLDPNGLNIPSTASIPT